MSENGRVTVTWDEFMAEQAPVVPSIWGNGLLVRAGAICSWAATQASARPS